ncbi:iron uptake porin [Sphaerospermopsis kisseleviana CS-549]|uniref:Iron uptake porin n=1 Tax=Sphaerospermopsis kisseleviana CS-549 TaxID=3021783 RepID=A0ABT4ZWV2_9CYAN|nr:iron uptake porin [Sphaerospermopsis kisseleviana]MDB9443911.1 iron uptake porin [Sphaerospermopsis kisseleviana CS-549]BAZ82975.1 carbohydrate-selective porin OprB [Sphaerospermopsis kisseleviana NIES-73]
MTKLFWNVLKVSPVIAATLLSANSALANEVNQQATSVAQLSQEANSIGQVTSVSQFSDVQPTDWAFQSLQSLVERYGCVAGYPNGTFRGNRALSRYEFAAGLNACLDRVNELIATATADMVSKEDLATLQRLQEEFSAELATLRGRVDALEARTAELEANQFSTTTKLRGEAIFSVSQAFGDKQADQDNNPNNNPNLDSNITFSNRVRLSLESSFMGTDVLQTRLNAGNFTSLNTAVTGTPMTQLGYESGGGNSVTIDKLNYTFNLSEKIRVRIDAVGGELNENVNVFNPDFRSSGTGALSRYGRFSPIYRLAQDGAGITVNVNPQGPLTLSAAYFARGRNQAANPAIGEGLFDGSSTIFGQLAFKPNKALNLGFTYAQSYQTAGDVNLLGGTGSVTVNDVDVPVESNNYGLQFTFNPSAKITLGGWAGYTTANTVTGLAASADIWYWAATLGLKDLGREGNTLGLIFGQPPKFTGGKVNGTSVDGEPSTSYHLEGLYKMKVSDNILITPGLLVIFNPDHNDNNDTIYVGTLRTTFSF